MINISKLRAITIEGEKFFFSLSFDIDDFIGDGIWWLQIYDPNHNLIYDKPLTLSRGKINLKMVKEIIKQDFLIKGVIL